VTRDQVDVVVSLVRAACPQQRMDDLTGDAWYRYLRPYDAEDVMAAVDRLVVRQPFVAIAEIIGELKRIRAGRVARSAVAFAPSNPDASVSVQQAEMRAALTAIASGREGTPGFLQIPRFGDRQYVGNRPGPRALAAGTVPADPEPPVTAGEAVPRAPDVERDLARAKKVLSALPDLGQPFMAQANEDLGEDCDAAVLVIRAAELAENQTREAS
jgi:hypothetical protein